MIITSSKPFTNEEIIKLREQFDGYIKTVIDIENKICSAGCDRYFESEQILLDFGSKQAGLWGGGIDVESMVVDGNSFINIRSNQDNKSNEILNKKTRDIFDKLSKYFFKNLYEQ